MKLVNEPSKVSYDAYEALKYKLTKELMRHSAVKSVYQMGSVKHPGISDLDLVCIFDNNSACDLDVRSSLSESEKIILTHGIFGVREDDILPVMKNNLLSSLNHLGGENINLDDIKFESSQLIKNQIAIEYMLRLYMTLESQINLGVVNLRSFLLSAKAIQFDLILLNIKDGELLEQVDNIVLLRDSWFKKTPSNSESSEIIRRFHIELKESIKQCIKDIKFYLPKEEHKFPGNMVIKKSPVFVAERQGILLPLSLSFLGKKYINLQYRFNKFIFKLPYSSDIDNSIINSRFELHKRLAGINKHNYPSFIPLTSGLLLF